MSLRLRLVLAFGYVLLFAIIALEVPLTLNFSRRVDSEIRAEAGAGAQAVAAAASGRLTNPPALAALAREQGRRLGGRVIVVDARGRVLVDSDGGAVRGAPYASRPEIASALRGATSQGTRHSDSLKADLLYTAVPIVDAGRAAGAVRLTQSVKAVNHEVRRDVLALLALGAAVLALGLGLAWAIAGSLSRPLRGLARTARQIAAGDLHTRATPTGSTEQVEVANAFNDMTDRLVRSLDAQRDFVANASHQLRTPLTGLRLRLESASLRAEDPDLKRDLVAGELETERLAKLLSNLLRLAQDGQPATSATSIALAAVAERAAERWRDQAELDGHPIELAGTAEAHVRASAGDLDTMVDNLVENALELHRPRHPDPDRVGPRRPRRVRRRPRPRRRHRSRGGRAHLRSLLPRQREPRRHACPAPASAWPSSTRSPAAGARARRSPPAPAAAPAPSCASPPAARRRPRRQATRPRRR